MKNVSFYGKKLKTFWSTQWNTLVLKYALRAYNLKHHSLQHGLVTVSNQRLSDLIVFPIKSKLSSPTEVFPKLYIVLHSRH